jgi:hypothetical protein
MIKVNPKALNCEDIWNRECHEMLSNVGQRKMHGQFLLATSELCKQYLVPRHVKLMPTTNKSRNAPDHLFPTLRLFTMSDSDRGEKKPTVPSWQSKTQDETAKEEEKPAAEPPSRETIIEQAKKFLEEDEVRNASTDKKVAFLESKGLRSEEIHDLLGVAKNPEASSEVCPQLF